MYIPIVTTRTNLSLSKIEVFQNSKWNDITSGYTTNVVGGTRYIVSTNPNNLGTSLIEGSSYLVRLTGKIT